MSATTERQGLHQNAAGQAVMVKLLSEQAEVRKRGTFAQLLGISPLREDSRPWYWGALGEIAVGEVLDALGPEWTSVHAVPVGTKDSDIDHVVVGAAGVFTINTKNHSHQSVWVGGRTFMVAGHRKPWIRNSEHEATRAAKNLSRAVGFTVPVQPLIVVHEPQRLNIKEMPKEVVVLTTRSLSRWLRQRPQRLSALEVDRVAEAAANPLTWRPDPPPPVNIPALVQAFRQLDREVTTAMRVRLLWKLGIAGGVMLTSLRVLLTLG